MKKVVRSIVPGPLLSLYHISLAGLGALVYGFPSRNLLVIAVTGTKGKTSTSEMVNAILEEAGYKTALLNSIRVKIAERSRSNTMRMSMPGRFFIQKFLRDALKAGCTCAILEMTSEGARQHRQRGIALDALIFTNLAPEHIESHGSYEAYADAKFEIGRQLERSWKPHRIIAANASDIESGRYFGLPVEAAAPFALSAQKPFFADERGGYFTFEEIRVDVPLPGEFSLKNALAASALARELGIAPKTIARALGKLDRIPGRAEKIEAGQDFDVIVDYAHTPDSLRALYDAYSSSTPLGVKRKLICVLSATGGGRDRWKRPVMGKIADERCEKVILADEDPYDEDPATIAKEVARGMKREPEVILDRRAAIARALELAQAGDAVLITGKGTDADIRGANGSKISWSDAEVAREELGKLLARRI